MEHTKNISTEQMKKMISARFDQKQDKICQIVEYKKIAQAYLKRSFKSLQISNQKIIKQMALQLMQDPKDMHNNIISILNLLLEPFSFENLTQSFNKLSKELFKMLFEAILDALNNMSVEQQIYYQENLKMNLQLSKIEMRNKKRKRIQIDLTMKGLFHLDIVALFLQQDKLIKQQWIYFTNNIWQTSELQQISLLDTNSAKMLYKIYSNTSNYLNFCTHKRINDVITILTMVRVRSKLFNFLKRSYQQHSLFFSKYKNEKQNLLHQTADCSQNYNQPIFRFNFSQIAWFSMYNQLQQIPPQFKIETDKIFKQIIKQSSLWMKKYLILLPKIQYNISINALFNTFRIFQESNENQLIPCINEKSKIVEDKIKQESFQEFEEKWSFMYLKHETIKENFSLLDIKKNNLHFFTSNGFFYSQDRLRKFALTATLHRYYQFSKIVQMQLYFENRIRPILAIKIYELNYQIFNENLITPKSAEEQSIFLILATINYSVKFVQLIPGKITSQKYQKKIREGLQSSDCSKFKKRATVLFDFEESGKHLWTKHEQFVSLMITKYSSRVYLSSYNDFCAPNLFLFGFIRYILKKNSKKEKLTKMNFYDFVEKQLKNILPLLI